MRLPNLVLCAALVAAPFASSPLALAQTVAGETLPTQTVTLEPGQTARTTLRLPINGRTPGDVWRVLSLTGSPGASATLETAQLVPAPQRRDVATVPQIALGVLLRVPQVTDAGVTLRLTLENTQSGVRTTVALVVRKP